MPNNRSSEMSQNLLLSRLPSVVRVQIDGLLEPVSLDKGATLFDIGEDLRHGYFPTSGLVSLVALTPNGDVVEVAAVARDGVVGLSALLHVATAPHQATVRLPGQALRFRADVLRAELQRNAILRSTVWQYANRASAELSQAVACRAFHSVRQRYCCWLLRMATRIGADVLDLTQETAAQSLGVVRPVVTRVALEMQDAGAIRYRHGHLVIIDRSVLKRATCDCYVSLE